jgi:hypothetical protein
MTDDDGVAARIAAAIEAADTHECAEPRDYAAMARAAIEALAAESETET